MEARDGTPHFRHYAFSKHQGFSLLADESAYKFDYRGTIHKHLNESPGWWQTLMEIRSSRRVHYFTNTLLPDWTYRSEFAMGTYPKTASSVLISL